MKIVVVLTVVLLVAVSTSLVFARIGGGDIVYKSSKSRVIFHHDTHVKEKGFTCTKCHPFISEIKARKVTPKMLHKKQALSCGTCHNGKDAFDLAANCEACHQEVK